MKKKVVLSLAILSTSVLAHEANLEDIQVVETEENQKMVDFLPSATSIKGNELIKKRQISIGDTLADEAGIQSTTFGPSASRPVIRGLDGDRIRVLQNGLGTLDASSQSLDHAIPVDTLTIDQIEVMRGPMSLLYGSSAVGGVVNLVTNRIHYEYEEGFFSKFLVQGETANLGVSSSAHLNYGKNNWMFHVDGSTRNLGDQIQYGSKDKLANTFNQQDNVAAGVSKIFDRGYVGVSFNHFNTDYGSVVEEDVTLNMTQNRFELHSEYRPESGAIRKIKFKTAQSGYFHKEIEHGETGTTFKNEGNESRLEFINKKGKIDGVSGLQTEIFNFSAKGEEAFLPTSDTEKISLFTFQQLTLGKNAYRVGGRLEHQDTAKKASTDFGPKETKNFLGYNASIGHCYDFSKTNTLETSFSYTERIPTFQELYADGNHVATGTYEKGNSDLDKEKAFGVEFTYKNSSKRNEFRGSIFGQVFNDYISLNPNGTTNADGFSEYEYVQTNAAFYGFDLENKSELKELNLGTLSVINKFDFLIGRDTKANRNLPRISPPRLTFGFELANDKWASDIEVIYHAEQTRTAPNETRTDSYYMTNIGYMYNLVGERSSLSLFARVRNIFDVEARNHVSFVKDIAALPGRNYVVGAQLQL